MEILDYQGGWRVPHLYGEQMAERGRLGVREEVEEDRHSRRVEGKKKETE